MEKIFRNFIKTAFIILITTHINNVSNANQEDKNYINFKSLKHNNSNMRLGPGERFEIKWNFKKIGLPVKVIQKYDQWFKVVTPDGSIGWMLNRLLSKKKTVIFKNNSSIYNKPSINARLKAKIDKNSIVNIKYCKEDWCKIEAQNYDLIGYTLRENIWGAIASEPN